MKGRFMKATVNGNACIGCGACTYTCPDVFELDDNGIAKAKEEIPESVENAVREASEGCPTSAISIEEK